MRKILAGIVIGLCVLCTVGMVNAAIVDMDDVDGVGYFKDITTGYVWMDVDNFLEMSLNEVKADLIGTDFHVADRDEMDTLFNSIGTVGSSITLTQNFNELFNYIGGHTFPDNKYKYISGSTNEKQINSENYRKVIMDSDSPTISFSFSDPDFKMYYHGAWVVNTSSVPIPGAIWLLGTGLIGLVGLRRKQ
ncbi:MAG: VPLPA-CTERM sorting domain-containing protein [Desulfobacteraceae bacterium]|nr:VPLPA-CTERM sorting domain-containing protein [Desulfobacteraceae bacterium]